MAGSYSARLSRRGRVVVGGHHFCTSGDEFVTNVILRDEIVICDMSCCLCFEVAWSTAHKVIRARWRFVCVVAVFSLLDLTSSYAPARDRFSLHTFSLLNHTYRLNLTPPSSSLFLSLPSFFSFAFCNNSDLFIKKNCPKTFAK